MALMPKRVKYRKSQRGKMRGKETRGNKLSFGEFGLASKGNIWITDRQIESARVTITHYLKDRGKVWIRIFPDKSVTKKPAETRMGKGKGEVDHWVAVVKSGRILFEIGGTEEDTAKEAFRLASHKLPVETKMLKR